MKAANPAVTGILPVYGDMRNIIPQAGGRWLNQQDVDDRRRVAVLGDELATLLFERAVARSGSRSTSATRRSS